MNYIELAGPVGIVLAVISLLGLTLIIERTLFYLRLKSFERNSDFVNLRNVLNDNRSKPKEIRDEIISFLLTKEKKKYEFGIRILRIIAVISPMLGLLGTVIGIIDAFRVISLHDGPVYPALIAEGLWTAMLTTAAGLIIALPCLFAAFIFARMAEKTICLYQDELNRISLEFEGVKV